MDELLLTIADYVVDDKIHSELAFKTAKISLLDSLACLLLAQKEPSCKALLGPYIPNTITPNGSRVPGTNFQLDPIKAAFDIGSSIRWLDFNDTWLSLEWGHPSDNLGAILSVADYICLSKEATHGFTKQDSTNHRFTLNIISNITLNTVLESMIKAYEIQGIFSLHHSLNKLGFDHVFLVKLASTAVAAKLMGLSKDKMMAALSHAFVDGASLRTYRHAPNTMSRKSWAAGDATRRGVELAWLVSRGQLGMPYPLTAKQWGFYDVMNHQKPIHISHPFGSYVMEHILYKTRFPAEFHAQTALEAAIQLHPEVRDRIADIERIEVSTQKSAMQIIDKKGTLNSVADRDHCLQYIIAIGLIFGDLKQHHYSDDFASDERIDKLRSKMTVIEDKQYSEDYLDLKKRSIANAIQIYFRDGTSTEKTEIHYPLGHPRRREEALPFLKEKYQSAVLGHFSGKQAENLCKLWDEIDDWQDKSISLFVEQWAFK